MHKQGFNCSETWPYIQTVTISNRITSSCAELVTEKFWCRSNRQNKILQHHGHQNGERILYCRQAKVIRQRDARTCRFDALSVHFRDQIQRGKQRDDQNGGPIEYHYWGTMTLQKDAQSSH